MSTELKKTHSTLTQDLTQLVEYLEEISDEMEISDPSAELVKPIKNPKLKKKTPSNSFTGKSYDLEYVDPEVEQLEELVAKVSRLLGDLGFSDYDFS